MPSSLFALLDDIATVLDDVALLTKVAAQEDRRRAGRRPRAQRPAGRRHQRRPRAAGGVGGGQGIRSSTRPSWCRRRWPSAPSRRGR